MLEHSSAFVGDDVGGIVGDGTGADVGNDIGTAVGVCVGASVGDALHAASWRWVGAAVVVMLLLAMVLVLMVEMVEKFFFLAEFSFDITYQQVSFVNDSHTFILDLFSEVWKLIDF